MNWFQWIAVIATGTSALLWLYQLFVISKTEKTMPKISQMAPSQPQNLPMISVIIPACNEGETLEAAMRSRLKETYPNIEYILIDDRSQDNTREIIQKLADEDNRIKPVFIDSLPPGWLGKVHVLHVGTSHASGEWLLFSDADVHVKPGTMNRAISFCLSQKLDHFAVVPELYSGGLWVDMPIAVFIKALFVGGTTWKIKNPKARAYGGSGGFNLVRRSAFEETEGFPWLKMEVVDDLALGLMMKRYHGFRSEMAIGRDWVGVQWYRNFNDMKRGMGRALYAGTGNFSFFQVIAIGLFGFIIDMAPYVSLVPLGIPYLQTVGIILIALTLWVALKSARIGNIKKLPALMLPFGNIIVFFLTLRAGIVGAFRRGIIWRGTYYSKKDLKKGRRFCF